jgi:adenine deaminase
VPAQATTTCRTRSPVGSLAPGRQVDILMVGDLEKSDVQTVISKGTVVVSDGERKHRFHRPVYPAFLRETVGLKRPVAAADLAVRVPEGQTEVTVRARWAGAFVAVADGEVLGSVALPLVGLLSDGDADEVVPQLERLYAQVAEDLGCTIEWPFHNFAFTAVVGELPILKMCDRGLFDVAKREHLSTIIEED